ncbi:GNAT family N-acetyltransferase [Streptococcus sp. FDAARGOS_192]|uniref:GNAT family N-acetyltransferase n=1 Tax=Streptococcus sp. FDAARGOS_192 TaxID=1839799 RepID=UPI0009B70293|nr:GNAT family N-acetyltransferase [Streptococcus sp. FDAARGOS_192]ARC21758.1 N-acetyltransferase [Streptococcus sp. FDAARGOS_192]
MFVIEEVKNENQKKAVVAEVLKDLPEWFGIPESTQAYIEGATTLQVWAAYQESDLTGFVSLSYSSEDCAEIDCLGVKKSYQGRKIGSQLLATLESEARKKVDYLQVKTVAEGSNKDYDRTNVFYRSLGFKKLEIFPQLWGSQNPCQILIKKLE